MRLAHGNKIICIYKTTYHHSVIIGNIASSKIGVFTSAALRNVSVMIYSSGRKIAD